MERAIPDTDLNHTFEQTAQRIAERCDPYAKPIGQVAFEIEEALHEAYLAGAKSALAVGASSPQQAQGTFACPLCGKDTPHGHTQEFIAKWLEAQGQTYGFKGRVLPSTEPSSVLADLEKWCGEHPYAYGEAYGLLFRARDYIEHWEAQKRPMPTYLPLDWVESIRQRVRANPTDNHFQDWKALVDILDALEAKLINESPSVPPSLTGLIDLEKKWRGFVKQKDDAATTLRSRGQRQAAEFEWAQARVWESCADELAALLAGKKK